MPRIWGSSCLCHRGPVPGTETATGTRLNITRRVILSDLLLPAMSQLFFPLLFFSVSNNLFWSYYHPSNSSQINLHLHTHSISRPSSLPHPVWSILFRYSWVSNQALDHHQSTRGHNLKENWLVLTQQPSYTNSSLGENFVPTCLLHVTVLSVLTLRSSCSCGHNLCEFIWENALMCGKHSFLLTIHLLLLLHSLYLLFHEDP